MTTLARDKALERARARRLRGPLGVAGFVGAATLAVQLRDPHRHASWGLCPLKALTGWNCPLCGGLRAVNDLGHGQIVEALHSNVLFVGSLPLVLVVWLLWLRRSWTGGDRYQPSPRTVRVLVTVASVLLVVFAVYRNTPWGSAWYAA